MCRRIQPAATAFACSGCKCCPPRRPGARPGILHEAWTSPSGATAKLSARASALAPEQRVPWNPGRAGHSASEFGCLVNPKSAQRNWVNEKEVRSEQGVFVLHMSSLVRPTSVRSLEIKPRSRGSFRVPRISNRSECLIRGAIHDGSFASFGVAWFPSHAD